MCFISLLTLPAHVSLPLYVYDSQKIVDKPSVINHLNIFPTSFTQCQYGPSYPGAKPQRLACLGMGYLWNKGGSGRKISMNVKNL